jgi:hypothetical protein
VQSFASANIGLFYPSIPEFDTPILSDLNLRVLITSSEVRQNWTYAGRASQFVNLGGVNTSVFRETFRIAEPNYLKLSPQFPQYFLRFKLPVYFKQATISIFGYTGT